MIYFISIILIAIWITAYYISNGWFIQALVIGAVIEMIFGRLRKRNY